MMFGIIGTTIINDVIEQFTINVVGSLHASLFLTVMFLFLIGLVLRIDFELLVGLMSIIVFSFYLVDFGFNWFVAVVVLFVSLMFFKFLKLIIN